MLTHENVVSDAAAVVKTFEVTNDLFAVGNYVAFLPLL